MDAHALKKYSGNVKLVAFFTDSIEAMYEGDAFALKKYSGYEGEHPDDGEDFTDGGKCEKYVGLIGTVKEYSAVYSDYLRITCVEVVFSDGYEMTVSDGCVEATYETITPLDQVLAYISEPKDDMKKEDDENFKELTQQEREFADKVFLALCSNAPYPINWKDLFDHAIASAIYRTNQYENRVFDKNCDD